MKAITDLRTAYLDFDFRRIPRLARIVAICHQIGLRPRWIRTDRTRRGWHVLIRFPTPFLAAELVALQSIMGSDRRRETLNLMRVIGMRTRAIRDPFWISRWNVLYAQKFT